MRKGFDEALREAFWAGMQHAADAADPVLPDKRTPQQALADFRKWWSGLPDREPVG